MKKIEDLEDEVKNLKVSRHNLETSNAELKEKLELSQASITDLQQKLMVERSSFRNYSKQFDSIIKNYEKKHEQELQTLTAKVETLRAELNDKVLECDKLKQHYMDVTRKQDAPMIEKSETLNQIARSLEESQRQNQQLLGTTVNQDNMRLSLQLSVVSQEKELLQNKLQELKKYYESLKSDVQQYENAFRLGVIGGEDCFVTDSMIQHGIAKSGNKVCSNEQSNVYATLKDKLRRCLLEKKLTREEMKKLNSEIQKKEEIIKKLKEEKVKYSTVVEKFKDGLGHTLQSSGAFFNSTPTENFTSQSYSHNHNHFSGRGGTRPYMKSGETVSTRERKPPRVQQQMYVAPAQRK